MIDLSKPIVTSRYRITVKAWRSANSASLTLYNSPLNINDLQKVIRMMTIEEREIFVNREKRISFSNGDIDTELCSHNLQLFEIKNNYPINIGSFSFNEECYSCEDIINSFKFWLCGGYLKKNLTFPNSEVKKIIEANTQ